jgi:carboxypeptidase C (cathepsin A)
LLASSCCCCNCNNCKPQGQFDAQDGVAGSNAWISRLDWGHIRDFEEQEGQLWYAQPGGSVAAGWRRQASTLTQVTVRNAGHMVPRDQPQAALALLQQWVESVLEDDEL